MSSYDIDKDVYEVWLKDKMNTIQAMQTTEEIEARILEISKIEFFAAREWKILHDRFDEITGRKRIPTWLKKEREKLITNPGIKVDWDGDPRKIPKEKKPKQDLAQEFFGINVKEAMRELKTKPKEPKPVEEKKSSMDILMAPSEIKPKATADEIKEKAAALKEKMRLAKEKKNGGSI